jgi:thiamine-phosphate pyrophosphorylase
VLLPRVHLITDREVCPDPAAVARLALDGLPPASVAVHVREKAVDGAALLSLARALAIEVHRAGQLLLVNDRLDVAIAAGADGVHLPSAGVPAADARRLLGPGALVGVSCHGAEDVRRAMAGSADYATFGPVFDTPSKRRYGSPVGIEALEPAAAIGLPLIGLGGVGLENASAVVAAGAYGVAAIRAWLASPDPRAAVRALVEAMPST